MKRPPGSLRSRPPERACQCPSGGRAGTNMDFDLSEQQQAVRDLFARFCDAEIRPRAAALDDAHAFPRELFVELARLGFFGMRYPRRSAERG